MPPNPKILKPRNISLVFVVLAFVSALVWYMEQDDVSTFVTVAGPRTGYAYKMMSSFKELVEKRSSKVRLEVYETRDDRANAQLLSDNLVDASLATTQIDFVRGPDVRLIAELFPTVFQVLVQPNSGINEISDLKGRRIMLPFKGTAEYDAFLFLCRHYGLAPSDMKITTGSERNAEWVFLNGGADVLFHVAVVGNATIRNLIKKTKARLLPIRQGLALQAKKPQLLKTQIPLGSYLGSPAIPAEDLPTVATKLLLTVAASVPKSIVYELTQILFDYRLELAKFQPLAGSITKPESMVGGLIPLHDGAIQYFEREEPSFFLENFDSMGFVFALFGAVISWFMHLSDKKSHAAMHAHISELFDLATGARKAETLEALEIFNKELSQFVDRTVPYFNDNDINPGQFDLFRYIFTLTTHSIQVREAQLIRNSSDRTPTSTASFHSTGHNPPADGGY